MSNYTKNETSVVQTFYKGLLSRRGNINHLGALKWGCGVKAAFPIRKRSITVLKINCHKQTYYDVYSLSIYLCYKKFEITAVESVTHPKKVFNTCTEAITN